MCERAKNGSQSSKAKDFSIDKQPEEILELMEANLGGNENYHVIGSAWLTYKAGELNAKATKRLARATWVLVLVSAVLALATTVQLLGTFCR